MSVTQEQIEYFSQPGFRRLILEMAKKYKSLGYLGGSFHIESLRKEEMKSLRNLLGDRYIYFKTFHITYRQFQKELKNTIFENVDFIEIIETILDETIYTNKEVQEQKQNYLDAFKKEILEKCQQMKSYEWLVWHLENYPLLRGYVLKYKDEYLDTLYHVTDALDHLPCFENKHTLLPIFSQQITKDPHYFDKTIARELLYSGIRYMLGLENVGTSLEEINELLYKAGLLKDDLSNNCFICHIKPIESNQSWNGFYELYEPWNMNLYNLSQTEGLFVSSKIYIVENPSVFRSLVMHIKENNMNVGLICSNGQINLCTYMLFDKLIESGCELYYAGDFDPEGLLIADKLVLRYQSKIHLWCYDISYWQQICTGTFKRNCSRESILDNIQSPELLEIAELLKETSKFGYQEGLIDIYIQDMHQHD